MAILETIALKGLTALSSKIITKYAEYGWSKFVEEFESTFAEENLKFFCKACDEYVNIRTLYSSMQDVFINDVYVPLYMSPSNDFENKIEITQLSFYSEGITNIIGKAGQGKSTFLRKMLINELVEEKYLPCFFELKNIDENIEILPQITKWYNRHNLTINDKGISRLLKSGFIKLFLDGFDEMPPKIHSKVLNLIKDFSRTYPKTTIIVTTRPETLITTEAFISNYHVLDLTIENIKKLFMNISDNNVELTEDAMKQLENHQNIKDLATTPILAILLFITYRAWSKIPDNLSDFYKKIFITLLTHHDSLKSGKKIDRGIDIPLNDYQIEDVFSVFCFKTFSEDLDSFSTRDASIFMKAALESECYGEVCPDNLLKVIRDCTGIICSNGYDSLTFSHKSLQEYYTALYIKEQSINDIRNFYKSVKSHGSELKYSQVIRFLSGIDTFNYTKYYYIPCFKEMFSVKNVKHDFDYEAIDRGLDKVIDSVSIPFRKNDFDNGKKSNKIGLTFEIDDEVSSFFYMKFMQTIIVGMFVKSIYSKFKKGNKKLLKSKLKNQEQCSIPFRDVLNALGDDELDKFKLFLKNRFEKSQTEVHQHLIKKYKSKNKPSLLKVVFNDN